MKELNVEIARLARRQHGLATVAQLQGLGVTRRQLQRRTESELWSRPDPAVVRLNGAAITWESELLLAVLAAGKGATASHRSAAVLWGLDGVRKGKPEITVPRGKRFRRSDVRVHESADLDRTTLTTRNGIPTTLVARTLLDLGAVLPLERVHVALDSARYKKLTNWDAILQTLLVHARRGRDGVGALRAILDNHFGEVAGTESGFERLAMIAIAEAGLPTPVLQHEVMIDGRTFRIDLAYPDLKIAIELDGSQHQERKQWQIDHERQNALVNAGWTILRFTWLDYTKRRSAMLRDIRTALRNCDI